MDINLFIGVVTSNFLDVPEIVAGSTLDRAIEHTLEFLREGPLEIEVYSLEEAKEARDELEWEKPFEITFYRAVEHEPGRISIVDLLV